MLKGSGWLKPSEAELIDLLWLADDLDGVIGASVEATRIRWVNPASPVAVINAATLASAPGFATFANNPLK